MLHNLTRRLVGALGIAALAMACWQMAERYLLPKLGSVWIEETVIYLFAWGTFLAVALLVPAVIGLVIAKLWLRPTLSGEKKEEERAKA